MIAAAGARFAFATLLGLAPLVANNLLACRVIVDAKTGSSGSGAKAAANTHHPQRSNSFYAYKPFTHQHVPEIEQTLKSIGEWTNEIAALQEYTIDVTEADGSTTRYYVISMMPGDDETGLLTGERLYCDEGFVRALLGPLFDLLQPIV